MHFTQEDYKKIENWLHRNSVKDTEFQEALPFTGKEIVTIVQDGYNRKVNIQEFVNQLYKHGVEDFLNITNTYKANNITLKEAIRLIPSEARKEGQVITFLNTEGNWEIYQFVGKLNQWNNPTLWNNPFDWEKLIVDSILPDEEDLTKSAPDVKGNAYLSLKDRKYEPDKYSGLGRKILRRRVVEIEDPVYGTQEKNLLLQADFDEENTVYVVRYDFTLNGQDIILPDNSYVEYEGGSISDGNIIDRAGGLSRVVLKKNIVNGKNILTQEMVSKSNTIYEIKYDFDLNNQTIHIPIGCQFDFVGGSLSNGALIGSNTLILASECQILKNITLNGTYRNKISHSVWFSPDLDGSSDVQLNNAIYILANGGTLFVDRGVYDIKFRWVIKDKTNINIVNLGVFQPIAGVVPMIGTIDVKNVHNSCFFNLEINGNVQNLPVSTDIGTQSLLRISECSNLIFNNTFIYDSNESGISGNAINNCTFDNLKFENIGEHGVYIGGTVPSTNIRFINLYAKNIGQGPVNRNRGCSVIKFRMFEVGAQHENIVIDGFKFVDETVKVNYSKYNYLVGLSDVRSFSIANGQIIGTQGGENNCVGVVHMNAVSKGIVSNVHVDWCREFLSYSNTYGDNGSTVIPKEEYLYDNIIFKNCVLKGYSNNFSAANYDNCDITLKSYLSDTYLGSKEDIVKKCVFSSCNIDFGVDQRMDNYACPVMIFDNCTLKCENNFKILNRRKNTIYKFIDSNDIYSGSGSAGDLIKNSDGSTYSVHFTRSSIQSTYGSAAFVYMIDMEYPFEVGGLAPGVYKNITRNGVCIDNDYKEATMYEGNLSFDFRFSLAKKLTEKDIIIIAPYNPEVKFTYTVENNIVRVAVAEGGSGVLFRVWTL